MNYRTRTISRTHPDREKRERLERLLEIEKPTRAEYESANELYHSLPAEILSITHASGLSLMWQRSKWIRREHA